MTTETDLLEEGKTANDHLFALVEVTDEGHKGEREELRRIADGLGGMAELVPLLVAATSAATAPLVDKLQAFTGPKGEDGKDGAPGRDGTDGGLGSVGPAGADGTDGRDGVDGTAGRDGAAGRNGTDGLPGRHGDKGLNWRGAFDGRISYQPDDAIEFQGSSFVAVSPIRGLAPPGNGWNLLARRGAQGPSGTGGGGGGVALSNAVPLVESGSGAAGTGTKASKDDHVHPADGGGAGGSDDQTAAEVPFTPTGSIAATDVQAAIEEVAAEAGSALPADLQNIVDNWAVDTDGRALINLASSGGAAQDGISIVADELPSDTVDLFTIRVPAVLPDTGEYQLFNVASDGSVEHQAANGQSTAVLIGEAFVAAGGSFELLKVTGIASRPGKFVAEIGEGSAPLAKGFKVGSGGFIVAKHNAAPADADLEPSDVGLWFDDTDGAAAPQWKGKSADGTVVSGSLGDQTAAEVPFTPAGTIAATNVQAAIEEVAAEAGGDIEATLLQGDDAGGQQVTNLGMVTVNPSGANLYGLLVQALPGFEAVYNAFLQFIDEHGNQFLNFDVGGIDLTATPATSDATHLIARNAAGTNIARLDSTQGVEITDDVVGFVASLGGPNGLRLRAFVPATAPDTSQMQIYYDDTNGAAYARLRGKTVDGTAVTGRVRLGASVQTYSESNVTTDRAFNANATSIDEIADVLGTLIGDLRAQGVVA